MLICAWLQQVFLAHTGSLVGLLTLHYFCLYASGKTPPSGDLRCWLIKKRMGDSLEWIIKKSILCKIASAESVCSLSVSVCLYVSRITIIVQLCFVGDQLWLFLPYGLEIYKKWKQKKKKLLSLCNLKSYLSQLLWLIWGSKENLIRLFFYPTWFDPVAFCLPFLKVLCRTAFIVKMNV